MVNTHIFLQNDETTSVSINPVNNRECMHIKFGKKSNFTDLVVGDKEVLIYLTIGQMMDLKSQIDMELKKYMEE